MTSRCTDRGVLALAAALLAACAPEAGLDARPSSTTCVVPDPSGGVVRLGVRWPLVTLTRGTGIAMLPDGSFYVVMKEGQVFHLAAGSMSLDRALVLDLSDDFSTRGSTALAVAVHHGFADNGYLFVAYPTHGGTWYTSRISRFTVGPDGHADPASERLILDVDQTTRLHSHGDLRFGPDGFLYVSFGDGGVSARAQDPFDLHGKILRLDVDGGDPYAIPAGNPFADGAAGAPEVYALGLRNPWRVTFDSGSDAVWAGDVGLSEREEVDRIVPGGNYGWPVWEGTRCNTAPCEGASLLPPVGEYDHTQGAAVILGPVYRGTALPGLVGRVLVADYGTGALWAMSDDGALELLSAGEVAPVAFAETADHEVIALEFGAAYDLLPPLPQGDPVPPLLSQTGCMDPDDPREPGPGLVPFEVNTPFWSDGATKSRWVSLPPNARATVDQDHRVVYPIGTVFVKEFVRDGVHVETRLLARHGDGDWRGYSYAWDESQTDAVLQTNPLAPVEGWDDHEAPWIYPGTGQCQTCHNSTTPIALGPQLTQLARDVTYDATGRTADQLATWVDIGLLDPFPGDVEPLPAADGDAPAALRARAWLHANCSFCHHPEGPTPSDMDLRYETPLSQMNVCGVAPSHGALGLDAPSIVAPGDAERSVLLYRVGHNGSTRMPPLASNLVDEEGVDLLTEWVNQLLWCP